MASANFAPPSQQPAPIHVNHPSPISPVLPQQQTLQQYQTQYATGPGVTARPMTIQAAHSTIPVQHMQYQYSPSPVEYPAQAQQAYMSADIKQPLPILHEVPPPGVPHQQQYQPQPVVQMQYAQPSPEDEKKQRRAEQMAKARHIAGVTCTVCGKVCLVTWTAVSAACSIMCCLMSCMGSDSGGGGFGGGGLGLSIAAPGDS